MRDRRRTCYRAVSPSVLNGAGQPSGRESAENSPEAPRPDSSRQSASVADTSSRRGRFEADLVVDRISESLLAAQVAFRRLNAHVAQQELNLLRLPASLMTEAGASASQIVRGNISQAAFRTSRLHYAPDHLRTEAALTNSLGLIDGPKYRPIGEAGGRQPPVHCAFYPCRNGYGPHMAALADKVGDHPMLLSLLEAFWR